VRYDYTTGCQKVTCHFVTGVEVAAAQRMALKLRRQAGMFTNESLQHRTSRCHLDLLRTGAASFKRVLGSALLSVLNPQIGLAIPNNPPIGMPRVYAHPYSVSKQLTHSPTRSIRKPIATGP
jgi:hypothetical protein